MLSIKSLERIVKVKIMFSAFFIDPFSIFVSNSIQDKVPDGFRTVGGRIVGFILMLCV